MPLKRTPTKEVEKASNIVSAADLESTSSVAATPTSDQKKKKVAKKQAAMEQLEVLVHQRGLAKGKITRILNIFQQDGDLTSTQLQVYAKKVEAAHKEYHEVHEKILFVDKVSDKAEHDAHYIAFDELHDEVLMAIEEHIMRGGQHNTPTSTVPHNTSAHGSVVVHQPLRMPIPTFDGKYENWTKFKIMFKDLVDKTPDPPAIKLYHLDKALVGSAAGIIDAKTINDGNYEHAWMILEERYENLRHMVDIHIQGLFQLKKMSGENYSELRALVDECSRHVENLKFLNQEFIGVSEQFVIHLIAEALDKETRRRWESTIKHGELPTYEATIKFLKEQCCILERCDDSNPKQQIAKRSNIRTSLKQTTAITSTREHPIVNKSSASTNIRCELCDDTRHKNFKCPQFIELSITRRLEKVREKGLCFNCLQKGHRSTDCPSNGTCLKCKRRHHTLLHAEKVHGTELSTNTNKSQTQSVEDSEERILTFNNVSTVAHSSGQAFRMPQVLLMTAIVDVIDKNNHPHPCRVLLDSASQVNLISQRIANILKLKDYPTNVTIAGVDSMQSRASRGVEVRIKSRYVDFALDINCLITKKVTADLPMSNIDISKWRIPGDVQLADPSFNCTDKVDMLIGNQHFLQLLLPGRISISDKLPIFNETMFGWILGGTCESESSANCVVLSHSTTIESLSESIKRFWETEDIPLQNELSTEEEECEQHFQATHNRDQNGRYVVELPLRESVNHLGDSRSLALRRFFVLERRFKQQPELKKQYSVFLDEYEQLGHCKEVFEKNDDPKLIRWYLPHHAVLRPSNTTTKCRVVFDASAKVSYASLNDSMMIGKINQSDLLSIVLRFREPKYVFTADVEKMYRQINVAQCHTPLQRIFWRKESSSPLRVLELTTVTYGTASAPFLSTRALWQLAIDERANYPEAASIVENSFYIDNALFGYNDLLMAREAQRQLISMLESGGFHLHKWSSNVPELLSDIDRKDLEELVSINDTGINEVIKTLGLMWIPDADELTFVSLPSSNIEHPTKRQILSLIARMYDPLGLISPIVVIGKILMQKVWIDGLDWDEPVTADLIERWIKFLQAMQDVKHIRIPRRVVADNAVAYEIHGFADASDAAYGACIYIRSILSDESATMKLVSSKSKVAPIAPLSIPRKELLAALLLHRLITKTLTALNMEFNGVTLWSDSQVVLAWLTKPTEQLQLYVKNRVCEIKSTGDHYKWNYVNTKDNPADIVSRGQAASKLKKNDLWWNGPTFLRTAVYSVEIPVPVDEIPELRNISSVSVITKYEELPLFMKFESFRKLQRIVAYVLRFCSNAKQEKKCRVLSRFPTITELRQAMMTIVKVVQNQVLSEEIERVSNAECCKSINNLSPFLSDGLLRVGGRLRHSNLPYKVKHQLILPNNHPVVRCLIKTIHEEHLHVGPSALMAILRQQFWILNCRNTVRKITRSCVRCFKSRPKTLEQYMGDLPACRLERSFAFAKVGIDFAGPIVIRQGIRKVCPIKGYICVFICLVTKGIHLEAVENLSTPAFIAALQRFVSRRGVPEEIYSDNGSNFIGAKSELKELSELFKKQQTEKQIFVFCQPKQIKWKTIPPSAPHFGGIWEAGVKSVKTILKKILKPATLTIIEFGTLLCQIEAILNSRPLYALSDDPHDMEPLTPGHLMINRPLTSIPEPSCEGITLNRLSHWQYVQTLRETFWRQWSREYLMELQRREKWTRKLQNVQPGTLVLVKEDNLPPQVWRLGKVEKTYPGDDGFVRVVDIRTQLGNIRRPIHKLAPLPVPAFGSST